MKGEKMNVSFMAIGDIYLNRKDPKTGFNKITPLLEKADVVFGNLETPLTTRDTASLGYRISCEQSHHRLWPRRLVGYHRRFG